MAVVALVGLAAAVVVVPTLLGRTSDDPLVATPVTTEPPHPDAWDERVAPIAEWVADERDLDFTHPVFVRFLSDEDYEAEARGETDDADASAPDVEEADAEEMAQGVAILRALGLVHGEVDLSTAGETLQAEGTLAYYVPQEQVVYVRGVELTPGVRVTLAHELTHVLQDQHFDLERIADPDFDRAEGLRALAEGDAERIEETFVADRLTDEDRSTSETESGADADEAQASLDRDVPPALVAYFSAPYALGSSIVDQLTRLEGPAAIDGLLADPPSEEELLDPTSRGTVRADEQDVEVQAPDDAEDVVEDVVGPLTWYLMIASRAEPLDALRVVDGWGGDALVTYRAGDVTCVRAAVVGDDAAATDALDVALTGWAAAGPVGAATVERDGGVVRLQACDPGGDASPSGEVVQELLALPVVRGDLRTTFVENGWPEDRAECAADRALGVLTFEELLSDQPPSEEQTARIEAAVLSCT